MSRLATMGDLVQVRSLASEFVTSFPLDVGEFHQTYSELIFKPNACLLVEELNGDIVGYLLGFTHRTFFANGLIGCVQEIMVATPVRRQGVGSRLMTFFELWASERGCTLSSLATRRAVEFYQALGYEASATYMRKLLG